MAIDSAAKRRAVAHIGRFWSGLGLTNDATPGVEWRQDAGRAYQGIAPTAASFTPIAGAMNETLRAYLNQQYSITNLDLVPLVDRYLDADTIADKTVSLRELEIATDVENR